MTKPDPSELFRQERLGLVRLAFLMSGSREIAEDIVQIAFGQVLTKWDDIETPGAYLRQVVVNQVKDAQRRSYRKPPSEHEGVTQIPEIDETWALIQKLKPIQRTVVVLRFYEDLALTDIAELLDRPESTVRSDLRRALKKLRRMYL